MNIRDEIVAKRRARVAEMGHNEGVEIPRKREAPIVPFLGRDGLICEVKRRSPSKGVIAPGLDAVEQAGRYIHAGASNLSVLTESAYFGGSIEDMYRVKKAFPQAAVLRKDFLFDIQDIDVAWRAGADAVLLIAGMLSADQLNVLYRCARSLGLQALVEIHDQEDLEKAASFQPDLVGINSRDLTTFQLDPLLPLKIEAGITWDARVVYESGISHPDQAAFLAGCGFAGALVGESVVRDSVLPGALLEALRHPVKDTFWPRIGKCLAVAEGKPLVKICGITREADARLAADCGAGALGFVFWRLSPCRAEPELLAHIQDIPLPKIGVVVNQAGAKTLPDAVRGLLEDGLLDAVQLHGDEQPDDCPTLWRSYYKALRPGSVQDIALADNYRCPRILLDAAADVPGGSGKRVAVEILEAWTKPLWLAGGITPDNVGRIVSIRRPELIDVASGVEAEPGIKDKNKLRRLFKEISA